jgi:transposase-like protein
MIDINDDTQPRRGRVEIRTGIIRRRRWTAEEKGRIVAEAVAPDAVIADVARRHDLAPQHLSNWIRAAKDGRFVLPAENDVTFVPIIAANVARADNAASPERTVVCTENFIRAGFGRSDDGDRREWNARRSRHRFRWCGSWAYLCPKNDESGRYCNNRRIRAAPGANDWR